MVSFVNFARIASICVGFHLGTLHGYFFHQDFWPNLNFPHECQIKLVLKCKEMDGGSNVMITYDETKMDRAYSDGISSITPLFHQIFVNM